MKFGINDVWNAGKEKKLAGQYKEIYLDPRTVKEAEENTHVNLENIEELADSFLTVGQEQPTVLAKIDNEFWIIDGHRRNAANIYNLERGYKEYERVLYRYKEMSKAMYELRLLAGNAYTQELTPYEKTRIVERMKVALIRAKEEDGLEIVGKMRDMIATMVGESSTNIARMEAINKNATLEIKEQFKAGNLGISGAYEASKLTGEDQKEVAKQAENGMQAKEIAKIVKEKKAKEAETSADPVLEEQIPWQMEMENDFPEVLPEPAAHLAQEDTKTDQAELAAFQQQNDGQKAAEERTPEFEVSAQQKDENELNIDRRLLQGLLEKNKKRLAEFESVIQKAKDSGKENELDKIMMRKQKLMVAALAGALSDLDTEDAICNYQPELPKFKNNDQRKDFINGYKKWPIWIDNEKTGERYYRYNLPDGTIFVIKTYHTMLLYDWHSGTGIRYKEGYGDNEEYILEPNKFFRDCKANRTAMLEKLKELQK